MKTQFERKFDHSGGVQGATNWMLRASNEVEDIENGRLDVEIGSITRRNGYTQKADTLQSGKSGLGLHTAKFSTGEKILAAINNAGDTETVIKSLTGSTWTNLTLPVALSKNAKIQMINSLDEVYVAGMDDLNARISMINIRNSLVTSATRNLANAPKARFVAEFGGSLYAMNTQVSSTVYPDRVYRSSPAQSVVTFGRGNQSSTRTYTLAVDSVRYLKASTAIDIYNHVTGVARYSNVTISSVNKSEDTITLPTKSGSLTFASTDVNITTDVITLSSTTNYPTGSSIVLTAGTTIPTPLVADTVYYVINLTATTIKLATTLANATASTAIDITNAGAGTNTIYPMYYMADNDEIYLTGRKGDLCYLWNTDYPTDDKSDFLKIPSGSAADAAITGWAKSNDRLFFFTETSMHKWDRAKLTTKFEDIGCVAHETIVNIGDWIIWLDGEGRINAYNDSTGQHEFISKAIKTSYLDDVAQASLATAAAGKVDNMYKLSLGLVGEKYLRVCYDFDSNNWVRETHTRPMLQHMTSTVDGRKALYFLDNTGKLFKDNTGNVDDTAPIPMNIKFGRNNSGSDKQKAYSGWYWFTENMAGAQLRCYTDGKEDPIELGKLTGNISRIDVGNKPVSGRDINLELSINSNGDAPTIQGYAMYFSAEEGHFG